MILNVSGRTDIVAFYTEWFMNRYKEGFVDVRNPFNPKMVSRIKFENVELILFCTKNPIPILDKIEEIHKPILFHITITPYKKDIEPNVLNKSDVIEAVKKLSKMLGKDKITIRYDPIFLSDKYTFFEDRNLMEYGFSKGESLSHELAYKLTGKTYKNWTARKEQKCNCVQMVDIGVYNERIK